MKNNSTRGKGLLENFLAKKRAEMANKLILDNLRVGKILDVGCGSYPYFLTNTNFNKKYGIDPSLKIKKQNAENLNLYIGDVVKEKIPFYDNYFDVVTMLAVFEHLDGDKLVRVLKDIKRVLRKNGQLVITTPAPWSDKLLHQMAQFGLISPEEIHEHKTHHSGSNIVNILSEVGFERSNIKSGYFELFMNMWFTAIK